MRPHVGQGTGVVHRVSAIRGGSDQRTPWQLRRRAYGRIRFSEPKPLSLGVSAMRDGSVGVEWRQSTRPVPWAHECARAQGQQWRLEVHSQTRLRALADHARPIAWTPRLCPRCRPFQTRCIPPLAADAAASSRSTQLDAPRPAAPDASARRVPSQGSRQWAPFPPAMAAVGYRRGRPPTSIRFGSAPLIKSHSMSGNSPAILASIVRRSKSRMRSPSSSNEVMLWTT